MPNPPLLGASRDEIARIIDPGPFAEWGFHAPKRKVARNAALAKADQILALPAFAGLLTPSLSHEEEVENGQWTEHRHGPSEDARPELPSGMGPSDLDAGRSAVGAGGFTPGQHLHAIMAEYFSGGGWVDEAPGWDDYDAEGHAVWEASAKTIGRNIRLAVAAGDLRDALAPFAAITPSCLYPPDGLEGERYVVTLKGDYGNPTEFTGRDLARARAAIAKATGGAA